MYNIHASAASLIYVFLVVPLHVVGVVESKSFNRASNLGLVCRVIVLALLKNLCRVYVTDLPVYLSYVCDSTGCYTVIARFYCHTYMALNQLVVYCYSYVVQISYPHDFVV